MSFATETHGLWEHTAVAGDKYPALSDERTVDVVVIGGGYGGLSAAMHLAEQGADVAVVEGEDIGFGGAGRNSGLVNAGMWVMPDDIIKTLGPEYGERLIECLGRAPDTVYELIAKHGIACQPERNGTLHCAVGGSGLDEINERARQWARRGVEVRVLSAAETGSRLGTSKFAGALEDRRAGTIQPLSYVRGMAKAASGAGAKIFTQSRVQEIVRAGTEWKVSTAQGCLLAGWVIVASEAYSNAACERVRAAFVYLPFFNIATKPLSPAQSALVMKSGQAIIDTRKIISAVRLDASRRLIIGSVGALRGAGKEVHLAWARRSLETLFPQLGKIELESAWYGQIGMTDDHLPKFDKLGPNMISIGGYNGRGIAPGTVFGKLAADLVTGRITEDSLPLPVGQPVVRPIRCIREAYVEYGSALAHFVENRR